MAVDLNNLLSGVLGLANTIVESKKPEPAPSVESNIINSLSALLWQQNNKTAVQSGFFGLSINALLLIFAAIIGVVLIVRR